MIVVIENISGSGGVTLNQIYLGYNYIDPKFLYHFHRFGAPPPRTRLINSLRRFIKNSIIIRVLNIAAGHDYAL